jgi:hypothetical protein
MLRVTTTASIYMENMWFWVAGMYAGVLRNILANWMLDHDVESPDQVMINVYGARGVLIESKGPSWVYGTSNEHSTLYNWQLSEAENVFLGHIQSETPYFQAGQRPSTEPFPPAKIFSHDPSFSDCNPNQSQPDTCRESWALRIVKSSNIWLYGGGFYSFFKNYENTCSKGKNGVTCQDRLIDTDRSDKVMIFNLYTVGAKEVISPQGWVNVSESNNYSR